MNIALSGIIFIILLLPAIVFRSIIIKSDSLENPLDTSIRTELGIIFIFALIIHIAGYIFFSFFNFYHFDLAQFYHIFSGNFIKIEYENLHNSIYLFLLYSIVQIFLSFIAALIIRKIIYNNYLDLKSNLIPVTNEWDNLLSGRSFELNEINKLKEDIKYIKDMKYEFYSLIHKKVNLSFVQKFLLKKKVRKRIKQEIIIIKNDIAFVKNVFKTKYCYVEADVLVKTSNGELLYKGKVLKYYLAKDNKLDKIILENVYKRKFEKISKRRIMSKSKKINLSNIEFKPFESTIFIIKQAEIKNLNLRYTFYEEFEGDPIDLNVNSIIDDVESIVNGDN